MASIGEIFLTMGIKQEGVNEALGALRALKKAASALAVGYAASKIGEFVHGATEAATHLLSLSSATGLSTEAFGRWQYLAQQSGSTGSELAVGLSMLERNLRTLAQGTNSKQISSMFSEVGVSATEAKKALTENGGMEKLLFKISDKFQSLGNSAERAALGTRLFGARAGRAMIVDLSRGSAGIKELQQRFDDLGGGMNNEQATSLRDLGNKLKDLGVAWDGLRNSVVAAVAPMLTELAQGAADFFRENRKEIIQGLTFAFHALGAALHVVVTAVRFVVKVFHEAKNGSTLAQGAIIGLALAILSALVPAIMSAIGAVGMFALSVAPFLAAGIAIAAIAKLIYDNWDKIKDAVLDAVSAVKDVWEDMTSGIVDGIESAFKAIANLPIIAQLIWLVNKLAELTGLSKGMDTSHEMAVEDSARKYMAGSGADAAAAAKKRGSNFFQGDQSFEALNPGYGTNVATTNVAGAGHGAGGVSIGPTTIQINGVKDAAHASKAIGENIDQRLRHGAAALNPGGR